MHETVFDSLVKRRLVSPIEVFKGKLRAGDYSQTDVEAFMDTPTIAEIRSRAEEAIRKRLRPCVGEAKSFYAQHLLDSTGVYTGRTAIGSDAYEGKADTDGRTDIIVTTGGTGIIPSFAKDISLFTRGRVLASSFALRVCICGLGLAEKEDEELALDTLLRAYKTAQENGENIVLVCSQDELGAVLNASPRNAHVHIANKNCGEEIADSIDAMLAGGRYIDLCAISLPDENTVKGIMDNRYELETRWDGGSLLFVSDTFKKSDVGRAMMTQITLEHVEALFADVEKEFARYEAKMREVLGEER